jgi:hypothetical protein
VQNDDEAQETDASAGAPFTVDPDVQLVPLYVTASPLPPTASQNEEDVQETDLSAAASLMSTAELHELPL